MTDYAVTKSAITPSMAAALVAAALSQSRGGDAARSFHGRRDFLLGRDVDIWEATRGEVVAQLVKAHLPAGQGLGWPRHKARFHLAIMLKGWARFRYGRQETRVEAGDCVHRRPGGPLAYLSDCSPDMEYVEIVSPATGVRVERARGSRRATPRKRRASTPMSARFAIFD